MIVGIDGRPIEGKKITGIGEYTKNLLHGLSLVGIRCNLYCTKAPKKINIPKNAKLKILKTKNKYFFEQIFLSQELSKNPPDIYHATTGLGLPLFYKGPLVLTIHDIIPITRKNYFKNSKFPIISKKLFLINTKAAICKAKKIISISKTTKINIIKNFDIKKNKIKVIYPGIFAPKKMNFKIIKRFGLEKSSFILNNGGISERKNLRRLIKSFVFVNKVYPRTKLVITGKNALYQKSLKKIAEHTGIEKNIIFTGFIERDCLWALVKKSDFICYPSEDEGFGLPIVEAIELGKPIILSDIPVFREIAKDFALFVNQNSVRSIARGIIELKSKKLLQKSLIKKSSYKKNFFSWERAIRKTIEVYKKINK
jgi:glycosyltransferase involved in cell wall biosynthesis